MSGAAPRVLLPAPVLTAEQQAALDLLLSGFAVAFNASADDLVPRGIVDGAVGYRRFRDDPIRWLRDAPAQPLAAFWLLVEEQHAARHALPSPIPDHRCARARSSSCRNHHHRSRRCSAMGPPR